MDRNQSDLAFVETTETWLREELAGDGGSLLAEMGIRGLGETADLIHTILRHLRGRRVMTVDEPSALTPLVSAFRQAADNFSTFVRDATADERETAAIAARFSEMAEDVAFRSEERLPSESRTG